MSYSSPPEDLDRVPPTQAGLARPWRILLGVALAVGLVSLGLCQWLGPQQQYDAYRAGSQAAAVQDWDAARTAYQAAGDFRDAPQRAAAAATFAAERDRQYAAAATAAQRGDWLGALQAATRLAPIAPTYRDTATISATAAAAIYAATLSGTVVLRPAADPPGLYAYGPAGARWLTGSDTRSQVWARCRDQSLLFDAPADAAGALPFHPGGDPPGRRLLVTWPDGTLRQALQLPPGDFPEFRCTAGGVWGVSYARRLRPTAVGHEDDGVLITGYQPWGAPAALTPAVPGPDWDVKGITPDGRHLLLLDARDLRVAGDATRLDLAQADGAAPRLLATLPGLPSLAQFSPDGRLAVLLQKQPISGTLAVTETALLIDLTAPAQAPRALMSRRWVPASPYAPGMVALFVSRGPRAGQVVLIWTDGDTRVVEVWDPARQAAVSFQAPAAPGPTMILDVEAGEGAILMDWQNPAEPRTGPIRQLLLIDQQDRPRMISVPPLPPGQDLDGAALRAGFLVYESRESGAAQAARTMWSIPLPPAGAAAPQPAPIFTWMAGNDGAPGDPVRRGPALLSYLTADGALHARRYDGSPDDVVVAHLGAGALFIAPGNLP